MKSKDLISLTEKYSAHNYSPLGIVISSAEGVWVQDLEGKRYLDMLSAYSAVNFGHKNPRFIKIAQAQLEKLTLTSRAFYNDQFGPFCKELAEFCGMEAVLPMNTGAEAVETALKMIRRWGYDRKGIAEDKAEIICFDNNFAGRTITIVSFSSSAESRRGFGPFTPGFKILPFGDLAQVESAINERTAGIIFEPIQGEGGVLLPSAGFIKGLREICTRKNVLMVADEIQTGLCRTGEIFACDHEQVKPDAYIIGKSLGGGIVPISAVISSRAVMDVFTPGSHGSTFSGNPFACAIAREVLRYITQEQPHKRAKELGEYLMPKLKALKSDKITEIRGRGLMVGIDIDPKFGKAKKFCELLKDQGVLCKDTRSQTMRLAPPLTIQKSEIDWAVDRLNAVFNS